MNTTTDDKMARTKTPRTVGWIATTLVVIGALNWGLVGLFSFNLVDAIFGTSSVVSRIIYVLVGLSGLYLIAFARSLAHASMPAYHPRPA
jgi:uncharacterized membrane protein YuzA (DUF378 family)